MMATINVDITSDTVNGADAYTSLREAITTANGNSQNDTINLSAGTYTISRSGAAEDNNSTGDFDVKESGKSVTIQGAGAGSTIIDANDLDRIFHVFSGATLILADLTITDGTAKTSVGSVTNGGAIRVDSGTLTVNNCVLDANLGYDGGAIYATGGTVTLSGTTLSNNDANHWGGGLHLISSSTLTINSSSTLSGNDAPSSGRGGGIYIINSTASLASSTVTDNTAGDGGGVWSEDTTLTLTSANFSLNETDSTGYGGAIYLDGGSASITGGTFSQNTAGTAGGAINLSFLAGNVSITGAIFTTNTAGTRGGAIHTSNNSGQTLTIDQCTVDSNTATGSSGDGAGMYTGGSTHLVLTNSTVSNNTAGRSGGGIFHSGGSSASLTITNSTISGNTSATSVSTGVGGGLYNFGSSGATATLLNNTIVNNAASGASSSGGGIKIGSVTFSGKNNVIANNTANTGPNISGTFTSNDYNLIEVTTGATITGTTTHNIYNTDPNLGSLQNNGGPTYTHAPAYNSPVRDAGTNTGAPSTDQRGVSRPQDGNNDASSVTDIGAVEYSINNAPTRTAGSPSAISVNEDSATSTAVTLGLGSLTYGPGGEVDEAGQTLTYTVTSIPSFITVWLADGTTQVTASTAVTLPQLQGLKYKTVANASGGPTNLTWTVQDNGGTSNGGSDTLTENLAITVSAVNDAPVNSVPGSQAANEGVALVFSSGNSNLISISDIDAGGASMEITLTGNHGTLTLSGLTGLTFSTGDGTDDATMTFTGTIANVNAALSGMSFLAEPGYGGAGASVQIVTNDQGNTGSGGAQSDTDSVTIDVNAGPVGHLYDLLVVENAPKTRIDLLRYFEDAESDVDELTFTVQSNDNTSLVTATIVGDTLVLAYSTSLIPEANITIRATDPFGAWADDTFKLHVGDGCCGEMMEELGAGSGGGESYLLLEYGEGSPLGPAADTFTGGVTAANVSDPSQCCQPKFEQGPITISAQNGSLGQAELIADSVFNFVSPTNPHPIIAVDYRITPMSAVPTSIEATITFGGVVQDTVYYDTSGLSGADIIRMSFLVDASTLPTGHYDYTIDFVEHRTSGDTPSQYEGSYNIHNWVDSPFGNRRWLAELDLLAFHEDGVALMRGDGTSLWYANDGLEGFEEAVGNFSTLTIDENGWYTSRDPYGNASEFDECGRLRRRYDSNGNSTYYAYYDVEQDEIPNQIAFITDSFGRTREFFYNEEGLVSSVRDFAGRETLFAYDGNRLETITRPDPDGSGPLSAPVTTFGYTTEGWLESVTDPENHTATIDYNFAGRPIGGMNADGSEWSYTAQFMAGLVDPGTVGPTPAVLIEDAITIYTDEDENTLASSYDRFGTPTMSTDALGNVTTWTRDGHGRATGTTSPDPDGAGPLGQQTTAFTYGTCCGNITSITHPDSSTETWTHEETFHRNTSYTDQLGRQTFWEIDETTGNLLSETRVVGELDDEFNLETDDVVTSYTYTPPPADFSDLPGGLLLSITDALGRVTEFAYEDDAESPDFGRILSITVAVGTADEATTAYEYDLAGNVTAIIDPLSRRTDFEYDALDRLISRTGHDPDGAGAQTRPVTTYEYDAVGNVVAITDPLGNTTEFEYDELDRVVSITYPDPDDAGAQTSPVVSYTYDDSGNLETETDPLGRVTTYVYDELNRLVTMIGADPDGAGAQTSPETSYTYDALGNLATETDPLGNVTSYRYDNRNRLVEVTAADPDGAGPLTSPVTTFEYDVANQLTSVIDPLGRETTYTYDDLGRQITVTLPDPDAGGSQTAPVTTYEFDKLGNVVLIIDALGNETAFEYDFLNRLIELTQEDPDGAGSQTSPVMPWFSPSRFVRVASPKSRGAARRVQVLHWVDRG